MERATEINEDCFVSPAVITVKNDRSTKIAFDSRKLNEATIKRKAQMPNMEELISRISRKISEEKRRQIHTHNKTGLRLCIRSTQTRRTNKEFVHIHGHRWRIHRILPFSERIQWTGRHTDYLLGTDRQNNKTLEIKHPAWLDDNNCHQRRRRRTRSGDQRNDEKIGRSRLQTKPEKM